jgi:hypothetical protein
VANIFHRIEESRNNKLILAARRLNAAWLRRNDDDAILDVVIGLETLLVDDSNRRNVSADTRSRGKSDFLAERLRGLCKLRCLESYSPSEVYDFIKRVYGFRNEVVHGSPALEKKRLVMVSKQKTIPTVALGIRLLRHAIVVLTEHPEYLDLDRIDRELGDG